MSKKKTINYTEFPNWIVKEGELFSLVWPHYFVEKILLMSNDAKFVIRSKIELR